MTEMNKPQDDANLDENVINDDAAMQEQAAENQESTIIGDDGDVEWNVDESMAPEFEDANTNTESHVAELEAALLASQAQVKEQQESVLRAKADVENIRRRSEQEIDKARKFALNRFAEELLPVIDNLERALQSGDTDNEAVKPFFEGVEMTHKSFVETVKKFGLEVINPEGQAFNPDLHQAIGMQESPDHPANTVMIVMQKGYQLNGRVIRPAMVMVAK